MICGDSPAKVTQKRTADSEAGRPETTALIPALEPYIFKRYDKLTLIFGCGRKNEEFDASA